MLREAMVRRMYRRSLAEGQIRVPAVPGMIDEYVQLCANLCATLGVPYTPEQSMQLRRVLEAELAKAFKASQRSDVAISFQLPFGFGLNYRVKAEWRTVEADYDNWVATRPPPLFGTEPDARVLALAREAANPTSYRVLDIGAGTGRNALAWPDAATPWTRSRWRRSSPTLFALRPKANRSACASSRATSSRPGRKSTMSTS